MWNRTKTLQRSRQEINRFYFSFLTSSIADSMITVRNVFSCIPLIPIPFHVYELLCFLSATWGVRVLVLLIISIPLLIHSYQLVLSECILSYLSEGNILQYLLSFWIITFLVGGYCRYISCSSTIIYQRIFIYRLIVWLSSVKIFDLSVCHFLLYNIDLWLLELSSQLFLDTC